MPSYATSTIFVIGGTGAQGMPIVRALVADRKCSVRVLTRDATSPRAQALLALGNVSILEGSFADEDVLREGFRGCDGAFISIDGFNTGEKTEIYWAIRSYEIAIEEGIRFFVYGNLDYALKKSGYDSRFRTGHYDGKGRIAEWVLFQNETNRDRMGAAVLCSLALRQPSASEWYGPRGRYRAHELHRYGRGVREDHRVSGAVHRHRSGHILERSAEEGR